MASTSKNSTLTLFGTVIPVALKKLTSAQEVKIERATKNGKKAVRKEFEEGAEITAENVLGPEDFEYGVFDGPDFKVITAEAIEAIEEATKLDAFEIETFIPQARIDWRRAQETYYLAPQSTKLKGAAVTSARAMRLLNRAMRKTHKAGVMKICLTKRQYLAMIWAEGDGLYVTLLAWAEDFKAADDANLLEGITVDQKMVDMAVSLINVMTADDPQAALDTPTDTLRAERGRLIEEALAGKVPAKKKKAAKAETTSDLEELLLQSLANAKAKKAKVAA